MEYSTCEKLFVILVVNSFFQIHNIKCILHAYFSIVKILKI